MSSLYLKIILQLISVTLGTYQLKWTGNSKGSCRIFRIVLFSGYRKLFWGGEGRIQWDTADTEGGLIFDKSTCVST